MSRALSKGRGQIAVMGSHAGCPRLRSSHDLARHERDPLATNQDGPLSHIFRHWLCIGAASLQVSQEISKFLDRANAGRLVSRLLAIEPDGLPRHVFLPQRAHCELAVQQIFLNFKSYLCGAAKSRPGDEGADGRVGRVGHSCPLQNFPGALHQQCLVGVPTDVRHARH